MSKFVATDIKTETDGKGQEVRVVKVEKKSESLVESYKMESIGRAGKSDYSVVKAKYGALASTDSERAARALKDRRFSLNTLLRDPLAVEKEEKRVLDEQVNQRVDAIRVETEAKAREAGYQEGLALGREEAKKAFQEENAGKVERFEALVRSAEGAKEEIFEENEKFLIELVFRIAKSVVLKEVSTDKDYVRRLAKELIERIGIRDNVKIRISPNDMQIIGAMKEGLEASLGTLKNLSFEASEDFISGGCGVETEWNAIDASIETQLKGLYEALMNETTSESNKAGAES